MSNSTTFIPQVTSIKSVWLNDVNSTVFNDLGGPGYITTSGGSAKIGTPPLSNLPGTTVASQLNKINDIIGAGGGVAGVSSFNTRTGAVTLSCDDVSTALESAFPVVEWSAGNASNNVARLNFLNATDRGNSLSIYRQANYTGGTPGWTNSALTIDTVVGTNCTSFEWGFLSIMDNSALVGENVAGYFQGNRRATNGAYTWGMVSEANDKTGTNMGTTGNLVGAEIDVLANGTDANYLRVGIDVISGKSDAAGAKSIAGYGIRVGAQNGDNTKGAFSVGVAVTSADGSSFFSTATGIRGLDLRGSYTVAMDTSAATNSTSTALRIKSGDFICMDGSDQYGFKLDSGRLEFWNRLLGTRHGYVDLAGSDVSFNAGGGGGGVSSFNTRTGAVTLTSGDVTTALGFTPASSSAVMDTTSSQTVAGIKTFSNYINANGGIVSNSIICNGNLSMGSNALTFSSGAYSFSATAGSYAIPNAALFLYVVVNGTTYKIPACNA